MFSTKTCPVYAFSSPQALPTRTSHGTSTSTHHQLPSSRAFMQSLVPQIIPQLRVSPFLQAYRLNETSKSVFPTSRAFTVDASTSVAPELWESILDHLNKDRASFYNPWDSVPAASSPSTLAASASSPEIIVFAKELPASRTAPIRTAPCSQDNSCAGVTGDECCDTSAAEFLDAEDELLRAITDAQVSQATALAASTPGSTVKTYGIVLKPTASNAAAPGLSNAVSSLAGCYLLRTVAAFSAGCTCTHFSLTPIGLGGALNAQMMSHWLV